MRKYNAILSIFLFLIAAGLYAQQSKTYCNNRFGFCVQYPAELEAAKEGATNADGIILEAAGGVTVAVSGSHNVMDWTPEKIYGFARADFADTAEVGEAEVEDIGTVTNGQGFETRFTAGSKYEYCRMLSLGDAYLVITITGPRSQSEEIEVLKESIRVKTDS